MRLSAARQHCHAPFTSSFLATPIFPPQHTSGFLPDTYDHHRAREKWTAGDTAAEAIIGQTARHADYELLTSFASEWRQVRPTSARRSLTADEPQKLFRIPAVAERQDILG